MRGQEAATSSLNKKQRSHSLLLEVRAVALVVRHPVVSSVLRAFLLPLYQPTNWLYLRNCDVYRNFGIICCLPFVTPLYLLIGAANPSPPLLAI